MENISTTQKNSVNIVEISGGMSPFVFPPPSKMGSGSFQIFQPKENDVFEILIDIINEGEHIRPIIYDDGQKALEKSISKIGILHPISVRHNPENGKFYLVAGKRRLHAAKVLGKRTISCTVKNGDPLLLSLMENLLRKDLTEMQQAEAFLRLKKKLKISQKALGKMFNKSPTNMSNIMSLNKFPDEIKKKCRDEDFSRRFFLDLLAYDSTEEMIEAIRIEKEKSIKDLKGKEKTTLNNEGEGHGNSSRKKLHPEKVVMKKLESTISAAVKLTHISLSQEDQVQLKNLYNTLGKLLRID